MRNSSPVQRRGIRLQSLAVGQALAWVVVVCLMAAAFAAKAPSAGGVCPTCEVLPPALEWVAIGAALTWLVAFGLSIFWLIRRARPAGIARIGLYLMMIGTPLLLPLGFGTTFLVPGLLLVSFGLRRQPMLWLPPLLMVIALALAIYVGSSLDERNAPGLAVVLGTFTSLGLIGPVWAWWVWRVQRMKAPFGDAEAPEFVA